MPRFTDHSRAVSPALAQPRPIETFFIRGWPNGWQPDMAESDLEPDMIAELLNMEFTEGYGLRKRDGYEVITNTITGMDTADHVLVVGVSSIETSWVVFEQHVFYFNEDDGAIYHQTLGNLVEEHEASTGADFTDTGFAVGAWGLNRIGERGWGISAIVVGDVVYITSQRQNATSANGVTDETNAQLEDSVNKAFKYDVGDDSWSSVALPSLSGSSSGFPAARCCITQHDRVFAANILRHVNNAGSVSLSYRHPNRIYWSDPGTSETWNENSFVTVGSDDDGSEIVALTPFRTGILVFKNHSTWVMTGTDEDTFALYSVSTDLGCEATYGVIADEDLCYFLDVEEGIMAYDGVRFQNISLPINGELLSDLNRSAIFKSVLWLDEDKLYVSVPVGDFATDETDHVTRTYVYDRDLKVWTRWDIGYAPMPALYIQDSGNLDAPSPDGSYYAGGLDDTIGVMKLRSTNSDNGTAITAYFETSWFNPGQIGDKHRIRRLEVVGEPDGDEVDVSLFRNFGQTAFKTSTYTPTGSLDGWHEQQSEHNDGDWWSWLKIKIGNDDVDETFQINGLGGTYSTRKLLRGSIGNLNAS